VNASEIAAALGGAHRSGSWWRCRCPVHLSRGPTLALREGARGLVVHCHAGCCRDDIFAELRRLRLIDEDCRRGPSVADDHADSRNRQRRIEIARGIWDSARDARGTVVQGYLGTRGITMLPPPSLRWAPRCRHPSGAFLPAMLAKIVNLDGELIGLHRTFLRPDGSGKADIEPQKAMLGRATGGAVRLAPSAETLLIGEGIESALAGMVATGLPGWASLCTSGLMSLKLPLQVCAVIILADHDRSGAGERAARLAAHRWRSEGRRVSVWMAPSVGTDANDLLRARCARHAA
jgi:hypothetical protein